MNEENPIPENGGLVLNDKVKSDLIQTAQSAKKMFVAFCISFYCCPLKVEKRQNMCPQCR